MTFTIVISFRSTVCLFNHLHPSLSSCKTDTVPITVTPHAPPPTPAPTLLLSVGVAALGTSYEWNHAVIMLFGLACQT